ncbi:MAG TPA: helix-turn-helix transcriptional regulator [Bacteroidia bacterium]|jgi:transcriptional regulator with XRE-family HTH domain|nr:helix-turn-helix transcriptional regulator [Bacteroidia bacterium]
MHIGKKIKLARVAKGLTQEGLAKRIHKARPLVSHIEKTGKVNPETLKDIFRVLDVSESSIENVVQEKGGVFTKGQPGSTEYYKNEIERLHKQIEMLMQMLQDQKETIARLKKRKK